MLFNDLLFILTMACQAITSIKVSSSKADQENILYSTESIDSFIASRDQQTIYFASTNHLISISPTNFSILNKITLGPVRDSPWCDTNGKSCLKDNRPFLTDVHTKILHYLPSNQILQCGSVKLGSCSIYNSKLVLLTKSNVSVAANSPAASTVSQIIDNRLVVAATATEESPYREPFPSVSIRELQGLNVENAGDLNGEAAVFLKPYYKGKFRFMEIFSHENFVFVVATVTLRDTHSPVTTRLIRFCRNDTKFASYSEIELQCRGEDNTNYPFLNALVRDGDKMVASFTMSTNSAQSSICVFSMQKVKLTYWYNLDKCRSGADSIKLPHIGRDAKCVNKAHIPLDENSCELGVGGSIELVGISVKNITSKVTSLMSIDQKVIFAGTSSSQILLLKWNDSLNHPISLDEYGRIEVGNEKTGNEVQKMIRYGDSVLIQMKHGIIMRALSKCADHKSCTECLLSDDPLCRWCHPTQSCATSSTCDGQLTLRCPSVETHPVPSRISVNTTTEFFFKTSHLPPPVGFMYECQFGSERVEANWNLSGLSCPFGVFNVSDVFEMSLMTSLSKKPISKHNITVFDCSAYATCSQCVKSGFGCNWCSKSHECSMACSYRAVNTCVRIQPMNPIAIGSLQEIVMEATNLHTLDANVNYFCKIEDQIVPATLALHSFRCGKIRLMPKSEHTETMTIPMSLMAESIVLEVTNVSLYSCSELASDCSSCRALQPSFSCSWCNHRCSHDCQKNEELLGCDPPRIKKFEPTSGPVEGGTIIRIYGNDLGTSLEDVQGKIYVAGSKCNLINYQISNMIECQVERGTSSGPIRISVGRATVTVVESQELFSFVPVSIFSAYPLYGPISGGTKIIFYGQNLLSGSRINVTIGEMPCLISQKNLSSTLSCISPAGSKVGKSTKVAIMVDHSHIQLNQLFEYRPDPEISSIFPTSTFKAGGKILSVQGYSLNAVQTAKMFLISSPSYPFDIISEMAPCHIINSISMTCMAPKILKSNTRKVEYGRHSVGFLMDNVTDVRNLGRRIQMTVYPNPSLSPFKGKRFHQGEQPLILEGTDLNLAAGPNDFKVFIGNERCYVTLVDIRQLVCSGPTKQPKATDEKGVPINGGNPLVTVIIGSLRIELGLIEYSDHGQPSRILLLTLILGIFVVITMVTVCFLLKRKRRKREKEYHKIRIQMDNLEKNVRKECKQAFAELQTNLALSPKPIGKTTQTEVIDFPRFVENLLWAENTLTVPSLARTLPMALAQFHALLSFKEFIFTIVDVAESRNSISEKSMLASLLISVLLRNFSYCTDIVISLLKNHIRKTVKNKRAELLFRNSDSLVEMMFSKWWCICLYSSLTPQMNSFYNLYIALQYQTDRGPVDAVTGDARYTINEARLLRECVETRTIIVNVIPLEKCYGTVRLELHSCDAICQVKQKVAAAVYYKKPYSQRPRITQFELRFKCPGGEIRLVEFETSSKQKLPVKLLTISDYEVQDGSTLEMTPTFHTLESHSRSIAGSETFSCASFDNFSPVYSSSKYYHLAKPTSASSIYRQQSSTEIPKSIPEVYLTRLLTSKGTVEAYIEDFFESVLYMHDCKFPPILKCVFDTLDHEAAINGVADNISHQWKANGFVLRVWANFIKNPQLALDLPHSISMDANLSTIAQTMMDCFSFSEPMLSAQSPSSRLLFAKDVTRFRPFSADLFERIKNCPSLTMNEVEIELDFSTCKGSSLALSELLSWVRGDAIRITQCLSVCERSVQQHLPQKLSEVLHVCNETDNHIYSTISDYEL